MGTWGRSLVIGSLLLLAPLLATSAAAELDEPQTACATMDCPVAPAPETRRLERLRFYGASLPPTADVTDMVPIVEEQVGADDPAPRDEAEVDEDRPAEPHDGSGAANGPDDTSEDGSTGREQAEDHAHETGDAALDAADALVTALPDTVAPITAPLTVAEALLRDRLGWVQEMRLETPTLPSFDDATGTEPQSTSTAPIQEDTMHPASVALLTGIAFLGGAAIATTGLLGSTAKSFATRGLYLLRRFGLLLAAPLFTKIAKSDALEHPVRDQLVDTVRNEPGITVQGLRARFSLGYGTIVHHIRILEHHGILSSVREGRHRRVFLVGQMNHSDRPKAALLANPKTGRIYRLLADRPGLSQSDLAQEVRVRESTVHWHVTRLQEAGLVESRRRGRKVHYFPLETATPQSVAC